MSGINTNIDYSSLFSSLSTSSSSGISGLASLASEYKNITTGAYRTLANAYVKKMSSEKSTGTSKSDTTDTTDTTTELDGSKMTSAERLQAAKDAAEKASNETFKQTYGSDGTLSGNTGYTSLFSIET